MAQKAYICHKKHKVCKLNIATRIPHQLLPRLPDEPVPVDDVYLLEREVLEPPAHVDVVHALADGVVPRVDLLGGVVEEDQLLE